VNGRAPKTHVVKVATTKENVLSEQDRPIVMYATFGSLEEAQTIGRALVKARLAACVNIFPEIQAIFEWQDKLEEAKEAAMFIKTRSSLEGQVIERFKELHSYDVPALVVLESAGGNADYLAWITGQTGSGV
jgi:periplasmic divalent cation tolerance protein